MAGGGKGQGRHEWRERAAWPGGASGAWLRPVISEVVFEAAAG